MYPSLTSIHRALIENLLDTTMMYLALSQDSVLKPKRSLLKAKTFKLKAGNPRFYLGVSSFNLNNEAFTQDSIIANKTPA